MCDFNPLLSLLGTKDISLSSLVLSAPRYRSVGFLASRGLTWDLEPVLHKWGRQAFAEKCMCANFVVRKGEARSALARVVEKGSMEDKSGTWNDE